MRYTPLHSPYAHCVVLTAARSLQRVQPGLLASLIVDELMARNQSSSMPLICQTPTAVPRAAKVAATRNVRPARARGAGRRPAQAVLRLGLPEVTGLIEIRVPFRGQGTQQAGDTDCEDGERFLFGLKIQLPSWLSSRILGSAVRQSHCGWTHELRTSNIHRWGDDFWIHVGAMDGLWDDDVLLFQRHFQDRVLTPFDQVETCGLSYNLLDVSEKWP